LGIEETPVVDAGQIIGRHQSCQFLIGDTQPRGLLHELLLKCKPVRHIILYSDVMRHSAIIAKHRRHAWLIVEKRAVFPIIAQHDQARFIFHEGFVKRSPGILLTIVPLKKTAVLTRAFFRRIAGQPLESGIHENQGKIGRQASATVMPSRQSITANFRMLTSRLMVLSGVSADL
jgi:hypothetical protein